MSNITVVTDTTETDNVTSISIDHDNSLYTVQQHDNKVELFLSLCLSDPSSGYNGILLIQALVLNDNVSVISLESQKPETVKIKIMGRQDIKGLSWR